MSQELARGFHACSPYVRDAFISHPHRRENLVAERVEERERWIGSAFRSGSPPAPLVTRKGGREGWPYTLHVTVLERNKSLRPVECLMEWAGSRFCREARRSCERTRPED